MTCGFMAWARDVWVVAGVGLSILGATSALAQDGGDDGAGQDAGQDAGQGAGEGAGEAVHPLAFLYGEWRGTASGVGPDRQPFEITQTERVGPLLGGDVVVIEGRGYDAAGALKFNALGVVSYNAQTEGWEIRSYNDGRSGTFPMTIGEMGYEWSIPAGPGARMVYRAQVAVGMDGDTWTSTGTFEREGGPVFETFSMTLTRIGDTDWPAAGALAPQSVTQSVPQSAPE